MTRGSSTRCDAQTPGADVMIEAAAATAPLAARTTAIEDPGDLLDLLPEPYARAWIHDGEGLVAWGTAVTVPVACGPERFATVREDLARVFAAIAADDPVGAPGSGPVAFASLPFLADAAGGVLVIPEVLVGRRRGKSWVTVVAPEDDGRHEDPGRLVEHHAPPVPHDRVRYAGSSLPEVGWLDAVARAVDEIHAGEYGKVVLARDRRVWAREAFDPRLLVRRLVERFPSCFSFSIDGLVGATPELLARREGQSVTSLVLAGSAPRGSDAQSDAELGAWLAASGKDAGEHAFAVDSVRDALQAWLPDLDSDAEPWLLRLANVQHLATTVRGTLADPGVDALALAGRLHPTAAVCGTPTNRAREAIIRLEGMQRGRYAGPVGWVDARGDGEFGIALRCAEVHGARARLFAGAGIVGESLPEDELEETRLKLRAMQSAFEG